MADAADRGAVKALVAALLIAAAAPLIGLLAIGFWFGMDWGEFSLGYVPLRSAVPAAYYLGGTQSAIAGAAIGWAIWRWGWVGLDAWMALTLVLAVLPVLVLTIFPGTNAGKTGLVYVSNFSIACYLLTAALIASAALRLLVIALGLMRRRPSLEARH
jgi:hypothetical protein